MFKGERVPRACWVRAQHARNTPAAAGAGLSWVQGLGIFLLLLRLTFCAFSSCFALRCTRQVDRHSPAQLLASAVQDGSDRGSGGEQAHAAAAEALPGSASSEHAPALCPATCSLLCPATCFLAISQSIARLAIVHKQGVQLVCVVPVVVVCREARF